MAKCLQKVRQNMLLWVGCIAGALQDTEYSSKLAAAGFEAIEIEPTRLYKTEDAREFLKEQGLTWTPWRRRSTANSGAPSSGRRKPQTVATKD